MIATSSSYNCVDLSSIADISIGRTPSRANSDYWGSGRKWLSIADMKGDLEIYETKEQITELAIQETGIKIVPKGSILFSFKLSIGKTAIAGADIYTNEAIAAFTVKDKNKVDTRFLYYVLREFNYSGTGDKAVMGLTLNQKKLRKLPIPLPPLSEQKRIVAILDKADGLRQNDKKILEKYDQLVQSVFLKMFGDFEENPFGFKQGMLGDFVNKKGGIICGPFGSQLKIGEFINIGIPVYGIDNVQKNKFIDAKPKYITEEKYIFLKSFTVSEGDILVTRTGTVGRTCVAPNNIPKAVIGPNLLRIRLRGNELLPIFLSFAFNYSTSIIRQIAMFSPGATVAVYNTGNLKKLNILVPPIELQEGFVKVYMQIDGQKKLTHKSLQKSEELFRSLLQKAFSGQLI